MKTQLNAVAINLRLYLLCEKFCSKIIILISAKSLSYYVEIFYSYYKDLTMPAIGCRINFSEARQLLYA